MRRPPVLATIVVALAVATMVALGVWQLERRGAKDALIARYAGNPALPPVAFPPSGVDEALLFRRSSLLCLAPVAWTSLAGRAADGTTGWRRIATCRTGIEGPGVPVQLGIAADPSATPAWRGGEVSGIITHAPGGQSLIGSLFRPAPKRLMLVADRPVAGLKANAAPDVADVPNNHLGYAIQWFAFATIAAVIYAVALRRRSTP